MTLIMTFYSPVAKFRLNKEKVEWLLHKDISWNFEHLLHNKGLIVITVGHVTENNKMHHIGQKNMQDILQIKREAIQKIIIVF